MAHSAIRRSPSLTKFKRTDAWEFRMLFAVTFVVLLGAALVERMLPFRYLASRSVAHAQPTIFEQARNGANTCAAYALMG